ncbi:hypothetical protein [Actinomadura yumaensis]|uniref:Scaffolding protein n=1 Tax=Actinomadura yumaensis TaxID=111807 RepID=A0ABW2CW48_9ACTN
MTMQLPTPVPHTSLVEGLPVHPFTGLRALAVLPSGRPVWPVLGGGEDDGPDNGGTGGGAGEGGAGTGSGTGPDGGTGKDGGDAGDKTFTQSDVDRIIRERLDRERGKYGDYEELKGKAAELDTLKEANATEQEKAVNQARKDTEAAVRGQLEPRINRIEAALKHGLPAELGAKVLSAAKRLVGDTIEQLEDDAKEFFAASPITTGATGTGGNGGGGGGGGKSLDQGVRGRSSDKPTVASGADLYAARRGKKT